jgi:hypothetical protein
MLSKIRKSAVAAAVLMLCTAGASMAASVTAKFTGVDSAKGENVTVKFMNSYSNATSYTNYGTFAGALKWSASGSGLGWNNNLFVGPASFSTFCIEFTQHISNNQVINYGIENLAAAPKPFGNPPGNPAGPGMGGHTGLGTTRAKDTLIRQLFNEFYGTLGTDKASWAGFQVAIWKIVFETNTVNAANGFTNIQQGNFQLHSAPAAVVTKTNTYLSFLTGAGANEPLRNGLWALTNGTAQDQVFLDPLTTSSSVPPVIPLPPAAWAGVALMGAIGVRKAVKSKLS